MGLSVRVLWCGGGLGLFLGLFLGCADPFEEAPGPAFERLCGEACQKTVELGNHLASIEDEASLEAALPKIRATIDQIVRAIERQNEIISATGFQPSQEVEAKWMAKLAESMEGVTPQRMRIAGIPGFEKVRTEMIRLTKIPPPKAPSRTASKSGRPKVSKKMQDDMKALGRLYHDSYDTNKKFPSSWEEAEQFCRQSGRQNGVELLNRMRSQGVTVHWGVHFRDAVIGTSNYVFAYEKKTPLEGGALLLLDGRPSVATPGELMAHLAYQADIDVKVFGKTPPVPVRFAAGTKQQNPRPGFMILDKPWPPESSPPPAQPVASRNRPAEKPAASDPFWGNAGQDSASTGGMTASSFGQDSASSSKPEPEQTSDQTSTKPTGTTRRPANPFGAIPGREFPRGNPRQPPANPSSTMPTGTTPKASNPFDDVPAQQSPVANSRMPATNPFDSAPPLAAPPARAGTVDSPLVGGSGGGPRRRADQAGRPMIGVRHRLGSWSGQQMVKTFDPLFERGRPRPGWEELFAKDGYAVGAIQVDGEQFVNAIRVAFMRIEGDRLNPKDSYVSDWIGKPTGRTTQTLNGKGAFVVGVQIRGTIVLDAVGLVYKAE